MPLEIEEHRHNVISPFLWNLLPDNEQVIEALGQRYQVSGGSPFALLAHLGEDCVGAVQFVRPERLAAVGRGELIELTEADIAERLAQLRRNPAGARRPADQGQFSLSGAQAKTAFRQTDTGWAVPSGAEPTTPSSSRRGRNWRDTSRTSTSA